MEVLYAIIKKNAVELVENQKSLGYFNGLFGTQQLVETYPRPQQSKLISQGRTIQNVNTRNNKDLPPDR